MSLTAQVPIQEIGRWLGVIGGVAGIVTILFRLNNLFNHLVTTDTVIRHTLAELKEKLKRLDDDLVEAQQENRDARAYIQDRLLALENRIYRGDWDNYVKKGIISQDQLTRIRQLER